MSKSSSPAEFINTLRPALRRRSKAEPPERDVLRKLLPGMRIINFNHGDTLPKDDEFIWLWNGYPTLGNSLNIEIGDFVNFDELNKLPSNASIRLLRIDSDMWKEGVSLPKPFVDFEEDVYYETMVVIGCGTDNENQKLFQAFTD